MRVRLLGLDWKCAVPSPMVLEAVIFAAAIYLGAMIRYWDTLPVIEQDEGALWPRALVFTVAMTGAILALGLHNPTQRARASGILLRLAAAVALATAITSAVFYALPWLALDRGVLAIATVLAALAAAATRLWWSLASEDAAFKKRVLVYGCGRRAAAIAALRRRSDQRGFLVLGYLRAPGEVPAVPSERLRDVPADLLGLCRELHVDEIVVAMDDRRHEFPVRDLLACRMEGIHVTQLLTFLEREAGKVRIDVLDPSWIIFGDGFRNGALRSAAARLLDVVVSLFILAFTWPLMLGAAIAIKLEEGWRAPVFYRQRRVGARGRVFELLKFRSMRTDAEAGGGPRWAQKNDPRVTRVGAWLRRTRIDELPQLLNVLKGEMSVVGPRPERPEFVAQLAERIPFYTERLRVKPGITGWAQVCYPYGASEKDALEKLQYDLFYIKNKSLFFDLVIVLETLEVILWGKGAR